MSVPYASSTSGLAARAEITALLRKFGCESVGFMDVFEERALVLAFRHRGHNIQLKASAQGWAKLYLDQNPWSRHRKVNQQQWQQKALNQGMVAVNSILRDWVKGQVTAIECGVLSFEAVFMPYILADDGRPLMEHIERYMGQARLTDARGGADQRERL